MDQSQLQQQLEAELMPAAVPDAAPEPEPEPAGDSPVVTTYNDLFPALPDSGLETGGTTPGQTNPWAQRMRVGTSNVTQVQWEWEVTALLSHTPSPWESLSHGWCAQPLNPRPAGGGGAFERPPPSGFSRITKKRRRAAPRGFHPPYPPSFPQLL